VRAWLYTADARRVDFAPRRAKKGGRVSLRHAGVCFALTLLLFPWSARAQQQTMECTDDSSPCAAGGSCPLRNLPYEEFIAAPPSDRGGRNIPPVADRPFDPETGERILVKGFVVDGVTPNPEAGVTPEGAQAAANAAFARETNGAAEGRMTVGHMVKVADEVTTYFRGRGYLVAKAFLPVQTVGPDSLVHIQVTEGKISDVVVEGAKRYSPKVLRKPATPLIGTVPARDTVESALLYTQDYPGVRLFGTFRPGAQQGETKLVLQVLEEDRFGFKRGADNYGSDFTGEYRVRGDISWYNPIGLGDQLDVTVLEALEPSNTTFGAVRYQAPVGPPGFSVALGGNRNAFQITQKPFDILSLKGSITTYDASLNWKYQRTRFLNSSAALAFSQKKSELTGNGGAITVSNDTINEISIENNIDRIDTRFKGLDLITAKVRHGLGATLTGSSSTADPNFTVLEFRYSRLQALSDTQFVLFRMRMQETSSKLSPVEQFAIAGPDAVRAYPVGEILRDTGRLATLEYRIEAPGFSRAAGPFGRQWGDLLQISLFGDYGYAENSKATGAAGSAAAELSGFGVGLQFGLPRSFQFLVQGAKPYSSRKAVDGSDSRVYGELSFEF
jgi:hemolysin activation/secretion protein